MPQNVFIEKFAQPLGPLGNGSLNNLTFVVKDNYAIAGRKTLYGNAAYQATEAKAAANAVIVDQLRRQGATCIGIVAGDDLAFSLTGRDNHFPEQEGHAIGFVNPHNSQYIAGGSSSGSTIAVVENSDIHFSIGSDTGGSGRVPASYCGVFGYRITAALVSKAGMMPNVPSTDTVAVIAKDADVLEKVGRVLTCALNLPEQKLGKIFIIKEAFALCKANIKNSFASIVLNLKKSYPGRVVIISLKDIKYERASSSEDVFSGWVNASLPFMFGEIASTLTGRAIELGEKAFTMTVWANLQATLSTPKEMVADTAILRRQYTEALRSYLGPFDVFCFPTTPTTAPSVTLTATEITDLKKTFSLTCFASMADLPQITMPLVKENGLPIGLSFMGQHAQDAFLLQLVKQAMRKLTAAPFVAVMTDNQKEACVKACLLGNIIRRRNTKFWQLLINSVPEFMQTNFRDATTIERVAFLGYLQHLKIEGSRDQEQRVAWTLKWKELKCPGDKRTLSKAVSHEQQQYCKFLEDAQEKVHRFSFTR